MTSASNSTISRIEAGLAKRHRAEKRFRCWGIAALLFAACMLCVLLSTIIGPGVRGMSRHELKLTIDTAVIAEQLRADAQQVDFYRVTNQAVLQSLPHVTEKNEHRAMLALIGTFAAFDVKKAVLQHAEQWGKPLIIWIPLASPADIGLKKNQTTSEASGLTSKQHQWLKSWQQQHLIKRSINTEFFTRGDSRAPESAGFLGSIAGSLLTLIVCLALAIPVAVMAAITLEEFAAKTRVAEWLEIAINNLAAVPSIIYGLLGLSVFLQVLHAPRSSALAGGLTLAILILPVMIIATRAAIRAVPPSMRQAATGLGASPLQVVRHHVLPYALPGIMTGTILSICRALGETAPLLMIGMVAFVADIPHTPMDAATAMPVEIYLWASSPEAGFIEKTSSGILVLLAILLLLNWTAIRLRNRSQLVWN